MRTPAGCSFQGRLVKFTKPPLSLEAQLDLLESRGLGIRDRARALEVLRHFNYYRLRAYWMGLEEPAGQGTHRFKPGAQLDQAVALYVFDRRLRLLLMDAIERIEVSVRTQWAHQLSLAHGAHAYLNPDLFKDRTTHERLLQSLQEEVGRSHETFIQHYQATYSDPALPPMWAACEVMSFGQLSRWFSALKHRKDRQRIAAVYDFDEQVLKSFLHHLTHVRNLCAHHARVWNRRFTITLQLPKDRPSKAFTWFNPKADRNLYNTLAMLGAMLAVVSPESTWPSRVRRLVESEPLVDPAWMGFPAKWQTFTLWKALPAPPTP